MESTTAAPLAGTEDTSDGDGTADADWVSRAQMVPLANVSEDTIKRDVKTHELKTRKGTKGEVQVRISDFDA